VADERHESSIPFASSSLNLILLLVTTKRDSFILAFWRHRNPSLEKKSVAAGFIETVERPSYTCSVCRERVKVQLVECGIAVDEGKRGQYRDSIGVTLVWARCWFRCVARYYADLDAVVQCAKLNASLRRHRCLSVCLLQTNMPVAIPSLVFGSTLLSTAK